VDLAQQELCANTIGRQDKISFSQREQNEVLFIAKVTVFRAKGIFFNKTFKREFSLN